MKNKCYNIYGGRLSKDGDYLNVAIVTGKDNTKEWGTIPLKLNRTNVRLSEDKTRAIITIRMLEVKTDEEKEEAKPVDVNDDDLPF